MAEITDHWDSIGGDTLEDADPDEPGRPLLRAAVGPPAYVVPVGCP